MIPLETWSIGEYLENLLAVFTVRSHILVRTNTPRFNTCLDRNPDPSPSLWHLLPSILQETNVFAVESKCVGLPPTFLYEIAS